MSKLQRSFSINRIIAQNISNFNLWKFTTAHERGKRINTEYDIDFYVVNDAFLHGSPCSSSLSLSLPFYIIQDYCHENELHGMSKRFVRQTWKKSHTHELESALCLDTFLWNRNYWHWIYESLPKVILAEDMGFTGVYLIPDIEFSAQSLALLGIPNERIIRQSTELWKIHHLWISPRVEGTKLLQHTDLLARLRKKLLAQKTDRNTADTRRFYLSRNRQGTTSRRIVNHEDLTRLLAQYGFIEYIGDDRGFAGQILDFTACEAAFGPHGAALANSLFMPEEALLIEAFSPGYIYNHVLPATKLLHHRHYTILANEGDPGHPYRHGADIFVNLDQLSVILERELGR